MNRNHVPLYSIYALSIKICQTPIVRQMIFICKLHIWLCYKLENDLFNINKGNPYVQYFKSGILNSSTKLNT